MLLAITPHGRRRADLIPAKHWVQRYSGRNKHRVPGKVSFDPSSANNEQQKACREKKKGLAMQPISLPDFHRALKSHHPASYDMVLSWAESGFLPCFRNPQAEQGWYRLNLCRLRAFLLDELGLTPQSTTEIMQTLTGNTEQIQLF